jgi:hypothetical protein
MYPEEKVVADAGYAIRGELYKRLNHDGIKDGTYLVELFDVEIRYRSIHTPDAPYEKYCVCRYELAEDYLYEGEALSRVTFYGCFSLGNQEIVQRKINQLFNAFGWVMPDGNDIDNFVNHVKSKRNKIMTAKVKKQFHSGYNLYEVTPFIIVKPNDIITLRVNSGKPIVRKFIDPPLTWKPVKIGTDQNGEPVFENKKSIDRAVIKGTINANRKLGQMLRGKEVGEVIQFQNKVVEILGIKRECQEKG